MPFFLILITQNGTWCEPKFFRSGNNIPARYTTNKFNSINMNPLKPINRSLSGVLFLLVVLLNYGCKSTTVLLANFNNDQIGSPPANNQATGTVSVISGGGSIIVNSPSDSIPSKKWCGISHPFNNSDPTELTGNFTQFGKGNYGLLASLYIPETEVVTVQFEASKQSPLPFGPFLHLDFMPEGDVRIDDGAQRFGHFPRNRNFVLSVNLNITDVAATAEISLIGANASGNTTVQISQNVLPLARQFGAVKFWVGFQHRATFFVDDIIVTRKNQ